jgi:hypothetical protein
MQTPGCTALAFIEAIGPVLAIAPSVIIAERKMDMR